MMASGLGVTVRQGGELCRQGGFGDVGWLLGGVSCLFERWYRGVVWFQAYVGSAGSVQGCAGTGAAETAIAGWARALCCSAVEWESVRA